VHHNSSHAHNGLGSAPHLQSHASSLLHAHQGLVSASSVHEDHVVASNFEYGVHVEISASVSSNRTGSKHVSIHHDTPQGEPVRPAKSNLESTPWWKYIENAIVGK
jgi:hypothetical protein